MANQTKNLACEFIGTFALTFIGAGAILTTTWTGGQPGLVGIAIAVSATMNISGRVAWPSEAPPCSILVRRDCLEREITAGPTTGSRTVLAPSRPAVRSG